MSMSWLIIAILAYFVLALVFLVDKYLLKGSIPNPEVFAFYVGVLGILVLIITPFIGFYIPEPSQIIISLLSGVFALYALFWFYKALNLFEVSRIVPAVGGLVPLFTFGLVYFLSFAKEILSFKDGFALALLIFGSVFINFKKEKFVNLMSFKISAISAFFFSLSFVLAKYVYLAQPFWNGFIWMRVGGFLTALVFFLFFPRIREEIFKKRVSFKKRTVGVFFSAQSAGALGGVLQNWAIALAPLAYVAVINALQGVQYVFLFIFTIFLSLRFPKILNEEISKKIVFQKVIAILLIGGGVAILTF